MDGAGRWTNRRNSVGLTPDLTAAATRTAYRNLTADGGNSEALRNPAAVGQPGILESMIPLWGSGRAAVDNFQNGEWGWGIVNSELTLTDVFMVKTLIMGVGKALFRAGAKALGREAAEQLARETAERAVREFGEAGVRDVTGDAAGRALLQKVDDGIPATGIKSFDALAVESRSFRTKVNAISKKFRVIEDTKSTARGQFDFAKKTFTYNPETMTRLDLAHEWRHFKQVVRLEKQGLRFKSIISEVAEVGAYRYERRLWQRIGATPSAEYIAFHADQLSTYSAVADSFRVGRFLGYHPKYRKVLR